MPNKLNNRYYGCIFFLWDIYTLFGYAFFVIEFDKMQIPYTMKV